MKYLHGAGWSSLLSQCTFHSSFITWTYQLYTWKSCAWPPHRPLSSNLSYTSNAPLPLQRLIMGAAASLVDVYHVQNHPYYEVEKGGKPISSTTAARKKEKKSVGIGTCKISTRVHLRNHKTKPISNQLLHKDFRSLNPATKKENKDSVWITFLVVYDGTTMSLFENWQDRLEFLEKQTRETAAGWKLS